MFLDSHCHIVDDQMFENIETILFNAQELDRIMIMCTNEKELDRALQLKKEYPEKIKVSFGWFCDEAKNITQKKLDYLDQVAASGQIDMIGEIGLDYYWDTSFKEEQKKLFINQIHIANKYNLPISIHMREASRDTLDILKQYSQTPILFHCFSGSREIMEEALTLHSLISFAGPITYKSNKQGPINVQACPIDRLLVETDSPYLSPVPLRGTQNEPCNVKYTALKIAELKDINPDTLSKQLMHNYDHFFSISSTK